MQTNPRYHVLGRLDPKGQIIRTGRQAPVPTAAGRNQEVSDCVFSGSLYKTGVIYSNVAFSRRSGEPRVQLAARLIAIIEPAGAAANLKEGEAVSVRLTRIRIGGEFPRIYCELANVSGNPPVKPAAAANVNTLEGFLGDMRARIDQAGDAAALNSLAGGLRRGASRYSGAKIQPAVDQWTVKAFDMIGFFCEAKELLGWSREAVGQYDEMASLVVQLHSFRPQGPEVPRLPGRYKGQLADLARVGAWTRFELEQKKSDLAREEETRLVREAAERADRALAESKYRAKGNGLTALLADCQTGAVLPAETAAHLVQWLTHITKDEGETFLGIYQEMREACQSAPEIGRGFLVYFRSTLARLAPPKTA